MDSKRDIQPLATEIVEEKQLIRRDVKALQIAPRQLEGMRLARQKKFTLFSGPRLSGKTGGSLPAICDHAWNVDDADICVLTISQSVGVDSGVWDQLVNIILPQYMALGRAKPELNIRMDWVKEPHVRSATKKPACEVSNRHGGLTKISLESLNDEKEVEERFKSRNYTMIYLPELSNFKERKTFDILSECLRSFNTNVTQFVMLADTNPADEGEDSWIYQIWYKYRTLGYAEYCLYQEERELPVLPEDIFLTFRDSLGLLEFEIADNIFVTQKRVHELVAKYAHDKDLYDRYIKGLWVKALSGALFGEQFREAHHIRGDLLTRGNDNYEMIVPHEKTETLYTSIDPGTSKNSAGVIFEMRKFNRPDTVGEVPHFNFLDEVAIIDKNHTLADFVKRLMERMDWWEAYCGKKFKWIHWSDRNVMDTKEPMEGKYYHELIREISDGRIVVRGAPKGPGSVGIRVDFMRRLLFDERVFISRPRCPRLITMFKAIPGDKNNPSVPPKSHKLKHLLDAGTYGIAAECYDEIKMLSINRLRRRNDGESGLVSVAA